MSSPEQSLTSLISLQSVTPPMGYGDPPGGGGGMATLSPPAVHHISTSSTPNSPQVGRSQGKIVGGMKKLLRLPTPTSTLVTASPSANPPSSSSPPEDDTLDQPNPNRPLFSRVLRTMHPVRHFRRTKRRTDKQYHSDDGYTSDPGLIREEDDDETDGDPDTNEGRRTQVIRGIERKLEKARRTLQEEEGVHQDQQNEYLHGMESTMNYKAQQRIRSRFHYRHVKSKNISDQQRKKIEKYEGQLRDIKEGGAVPDSTYGGRLKGRIEGSLRGMTRLKGRLPNAGNLFRRKWFVGGQTPDEGEGIDDEEMYGEDVLGQGSNEDLCPSESQTFTNDSDLHIPDLESVQEAGEEDCGWIHEQQKLREEIDEQKEQISQLDESLSALFEKLDQEKETSERLEAQINDIMDLHQHEVGELRTQLAQMENLTMGKSQDLEDALEECQSKVDRLDAFVHQLIDSSGQQQGVSVVRRPLAGALSFVLVIIAFILATTQKLTYVLRTRLGLSVALFMVLVALLLYWLYY